MDEASRARREWIDAEAAVRQREKEAQEAVERAAVARAAQQEAEHVAAEKEARAFSLTNVAQIAVGDAKRAREAANEAWSVLAAFYPK